MRAPPIFAIVTAISALAVFSFRVGADDVRNSQWHLQFLRVAEAHQQSRGRDVTVAVVDTGVARHPDLQGSVIPGFVVDPAGQGDGTNDHSGHGTAMAGLIAGHGPRMTGVLGIAPESKILPIVDSTSGGTTSPDITADGINLAIDQGADIVNVSASGGPSERLQHAVERARRENVVLVAAAGNAPSSIIGFPANYPGVVAVGASDRSGAVAAISARGAGLVLVAPGVDIMTTRLNSRYGVGSGTSDSTAIVSGAAALVRSRFPGLSAAEVVDRLTATATDMGPPGRDDHYGYGVLNLVAALTADVPSRSQPTTSATVRDRDVGAPPGDDGQGGGRWVAIGGLVAVAVVIMAFGVHARARRRRGEAGR